MHRDVRALCRRAVRWQPPSRLAMSRRERRLRRSGDAPRRRGITLAEVSVSTMLVGILLVASLKSSSFLTNESALSSDRTRAERLAQSLAVEILSLPFADPEVDEASLGPDAGEATATRSQFDDVDDYHNWSASPPQSRLGHDLAGFDGWKREVEVEHVAPAALSASASETGLKRITVTVTAAGGSAVTVTALAGDPGKADPGIDSYDKQISWVGIEFTDSESRPVELSTGIRNRVLSDLSLPTGD